MAYRLIVKPGAELDIIKFLQLNSYTDWILNFKGYPMSLGIFKNVIAISGLYL
tara:strand:+ start:161401 stop:161559 length:159 start_codon:yes stop_codon:yes gene_type:complete